MSSFGTSLEPGATGDEFLPRCEIPPGANGCIYEINAGGATSSGSFRQDQQPQPQAGQVANQGPSTLDVTINEGLRFSTNDARRQGPNVPNHARTRAASGATWVNVRAIGSAQEGAEASHVLSGTLGTQLVAQDFGFRIPLAAQPELLTVEIDRRGAISEEALSAIVCGAQAGGGAAGMVYNGFAHTYVVDAGSTVTQGAAITDFLAGTDSAGSFYYIEASALAKYDASFVSQWSVPATANSGAVDESDRVFVSAGSVSSAPLNVYRINPATGATVWTTDVYDGGLGGTQIIHSTYAAAGKVMVQRKASFSQHAVVLDAATGNVTAIYPFGGGSTPGFAILGADGNIYSFDPAEVGGDLDRLSGSTWSVSISPGDEPQQLVHDAVNGALYARSNNTIYRYDPDDGSLVWSKTLTDVSNIGVDREGSHYAIFYDSGADAYKFRKYAPADGSTVWTSSGISTAEGGEEALLAYGASALIPINLLLDEGYATADGDYTCALTPLTIVAQTPGKVTATLDLSDWTPEEINDLSFGVTYAAAGSGVASVDAVRAWVDYSGAFGEALPAKRPLGLAGVAISPMGRRVAVGVGGKALYSDDGQTWLAASVPTNATLLDVTWDYTAGHFVAVGHGVILTGDGATWQRVDAGIPETLWAVAYDRADRVLLAVGDSGVQAAPDDSGQWLTRYR